MSFYGLANPMIARCRDRPEGPEYTDGSGFGKAVRVEITPNYVDTGEYGDVNDLDQKKEFAYADITLGINRIPEDGESIVLGYTQDGQEIQSSDMDESEYIGLGLLKRESVGNQKFFMALWLHKVKLWEDSDSQETKGESIDYVTPTLSGRAEPDSAGQWRSNRRFETRSEAISWLESKAGMEGG